MRSEQDVGAAHESDPSVAPTGQEGENAVEDVVLRCQRDFVCR